MTKILTTNEVEIDGLCMLRQGMKKETKGYQQHLKRNTA